MLAFLIYECLSQALSSLSRRYYGRHYHLGQTPKPSGVHCDHNLAALRTKCKAGVQPCPGTDQTLQCACLSSQEEGSLKIQLYLLTSEASRWLLPNISTFFFHFPFPSCSHTELIGSLDLGIISIIIFLPNLSVVFFFFF